MTRMNARWAICLLFAVYTLGTGLFPGIVPGGIDGVSLTIFVVVFALVHGAARYGWGGILVFVAICLVVSNALENLSILTGIPFGRYYYSDVLGLKLFHVPVIIGGAYAGAGYLSWIVAHVLVDRTGQSDRFAIWALPLVGALLTGSGFDQVQIVREDLTVRQGDQVSILTLQSIDFAPIKAHRFGHIAGFETEFAALEGLYFAGHAIAIFENDNVVSALTQRCRCVTRDQ